MIDTEAVAWAYNKLNAFGVGNSNMDSAMMLDRLNYMLAAAPTPPAQDEPVAWIDPDNLDCVLRQGGGGALRYIMPEPERSTDIPLYTRPQSDKLRKAAEELNQFIHDGMRFDDDAYKTEMLRLVENLRSALEGR